MTDYTGFHGTDPLEQNGNFLALKVEAPEGSTIVVDLVGGTKGPVTLDADKNIVLHISDKSAESVKVTVTLGDESVVKTYSLSNLVIDPAA